MINKQNTHSNDTTHFGFTTVSSSEKQSLVRNIFDNVAEKYDIMNDVMSGGLHRLWKDELIRELRPTANMHLLDVAGGTGDIALRFLKEMPVQSEEKILPAHVTVCDINFNMLSVGRGRALDLGIIKNIEWVTGNAEQLPLPDHSVDAYTIAFGIRNVTHIDKALKEAYRVLKPGGRFLCLEFSKIDIPLLEKMYEFYSFNLIPKLGSIIVGDEESYRYLVESIRKFPSQEKFKKMTEEVGFSKTTYKNLSGGIVALHSGWRI